MEDKRACENCKHFVIRDSKGVVLCGCESWECEFEPKEGEDKEGKWIEVWDKDHLIILAYKCSECGSMRNTKTSYCADCGAKMEEVKNERVVHTRDNSRNV